MSETLKFKFTPVGGPDEAAATSNPHAKSTTFVPEIIEALRAEFGEAVGEVTLYANEQTVYVDKAKIADVCLFLRDQKGFNYLADMGGIDRFTEEDRFEVYYNIVSIKGRMRLRVKVRIDESEITVGTISGVYKAAEWNEREVFDMFGIQFEGHPDLRRMYLPDDFKHHPLRKEFPALGIPGSLPLPAADSSGELQHDPFPASRPGHRPQ